MADNTYTGAGAYTGQGGGFSANPAGATNANQTPPAGTSSTSAPNSNNNTPNASQQTTAASASAINFVADFSDGKINLPGQDAFEGGLGEAAGNFVASGTYRQQNDVHDGIHKIEKTAALLTLASSNYVRSQNAQEYENFVKNGGREFLLDNGIMSNDMVGAFRNGTGLTLTEDQIKSVAQFGFYETTPIKFDESECRLLNQFLTTQSPEDLRAVQNLFGAKGVTCKSDTLLDTMVTSRQIVSGGLLTGTYSEKVTLGSSEMERAKTAVADKECFDSLFGKDKKKDKADAMEYVRAKTVKTIGIEEFTGTKKQMKELATRHAEPIRNIHGKIMMVSPAEAFERATGIATTDDLLKSAKITGHMTINGQSVKLNNEQMKLVKEMAGKKETALVSMKRGFSDKKGRFVEVDENKYAEIKEKMGVVGETKEKQRSEQIKKGQVEKVATAFMDQDAKTGMHFSKNTVKITAKSAAMAYRGALLASDNIKIAAHVAAGAGVGIASGAVALGGKLGLVSADRVSDVKGSLKGAKDAIKQSKGIAKDDKKSRKEVFAKDKEYRKEKRKGNKESIAAAKNKRDAARLHRKNEIFDRKEAAYRKKHNGQASERFKRREARNEKLSVKSKKREERLNKRNEKRKNRKERRQSRRQARLDKFKSTKLGKAWTKVSQGKFGKFMGKAGGVLGKIVKAPFALYNKIFDFFARIKKMLLKYLGLAGLWFLGIYLILCAILIVVSAICNFFSFIITDDTNYGQLLVADMKEIEESFLDMVKKDGVNYYQDAINNAGNEAAKDRLIYSTRYGDGTRIINAVAPQATIGNYYVSTTSADDYVQTDSLGSALPYFGIMRHRYFAEEIDGGLYGLAKAQMFNLWVKAHTLRPAYSYSYTLDYHPNLTECGSCKYTHPTSELFGVIPSDSFGDCDNYKAVPYAGSVVCHHVCGLDTGCVTVPSYLACGLPHGQKDANGTVHYHSSECYQYAKTLVCGCSQNPDGSPHTHTDSCYQPAYVHNCIHEHAKWESEESPGCYATRYKYVCLGHCSGYISPIVDIFYKDGVSAIAALDVDTSVPGDCASFHPSHKLEKDEICAYPPDSSATSRYTKNKITNVDGWVQYWNDTMDKINAHSSKGLMTAEGIDDYTDMDYRTGTDECYVLNKFPNSYKELKDTDIKDIESMIGTAETGYVEGIENWKEFEVYFAEENMNVLSKETRTEIEAFLASEYGVDLSKDADGRLVDGKISNQIIDAALSQAGKMQFNKNLTISQGSLRLINILLIGPNEGAYPDFDFYKHKAKDANEVFTLCGAAHQYKDLEPGSILVNTKREKLGIYLGRYSEEGYRILDYNPGNANCSIYVIGWDEMETRYDKAISTEDMNSQGKMGWWILDNQKKKFPWPND